MNLQRNTDPLSLSAPSEVPAKQIYFPLLSRPPQAALFASF